MQIKAENLQLQYFQTYY